jgi:pyrimidine-specific ribonucleoside hydrolase
MRNKYFILFGISLFFFQAAKSQSVFPTGNYPLSVIFDSDFGPDYDDVGAITLLHGFADSGYVRILATIASSGHKNVAAALNVFNTYFGRPDIPIGVVGGQALTFSDRQHWTDSIISRYPHAIKNNQDAVDALKLYRKILAAEPDHSVSIVTVGFLTNLSNLLLSPPDEFSDLDGYHLVKQKVFKLVSMGGRFPAGQEYNLDQDVKSSARVLSDWPTTILFSGFEIGVKIRTGLPLIHNEKIKNSPVKDVFAICIPFSAEDSAGRMSWDETAVFVTVKGWQDYYSLEMGQCGIQPDGTNYWIRKGKMQAHLLEKRSPLYMQALIEHMIER